MTCEQRDTLLLYYTLGCHLCEQAEALVKPIAAGHGRRLALCEISESDELLARYGVRIPVLRDPARDCELDWPFSSEDVLAFVG